ncbi:MAG: CpsD/CapB family tyrosine-protein kinase [Pseudomonadales bacterium]
MQDAIARARLERQGEVGKLPRYDQQRETSQRGYKLPELDKPRVYAPQPRRPISTPPPENIEYTTTRRVRLNEALLEKNRVIASQHDDHRVETYRKLRTRVLQTLDRNGWSTLAITSPLEDAGKTLTAVNLAISLSHEVNHTVMLVDLDLKSPGVHTTLGVDVEWGLVDVVTGRVGLEHALFNPSMPRMVVLPGKPLGRHSSEVLTSPGMKAMLREITTRYASRLVVFDLPPLLRNDDALLFTPFADATLLVVEDGVNTPDEVERSQQMMQHANLIGTILNKAR